MLFQNIPVWEGFQWINDPKIVSVLASALPYAGTGRRGYGKVTLVRWLLYKQCHNCTYRDLEEMSGIDYTTFVKCRAVLKRTRWLEKMFHLIVQEIASHSRLTLIMDSSFVEQYARGREHGAEYSGFKKKTGFKVHQIIDFRTRVPVAQRVTGGSRADVVLAKEMVECLPPTWNVSAFLADKGYDSTPLVAQLRRTWSGVNVGIPVRKTNQSSLQSRREETLKNQYAKQSFRCLDVRLYRKRTEIERYFSRKKEVFHLGRERTRGIENFSTNCLMADLCAQLEFLATPARGVFHQARGIVEAWIANSYASVKFRPYIIIQKRFLLHIRALRE